MVNVREKPLGPLTAYGVSLTVAIEIARRAHEGQVDKTGHPYIEHPRRVANWLEPDDLDGRIVEKKSPRRWRNVEVPCPGAGRRWVRFNRVGNAACGSCLRRPKDFGVDYEPKVNSPHHIVPAHTKTTKELS